MALVLGIFLGGIVTAIPVVTGVAEGVEFQKKQNEEAANETRMIKFNILTACDADDDLAEEVDKGIAIVRHDKVYSSIPLQPRLHPHTQFPPFTLSERNGPLTCLPIP